MTTKTSKSAFAAFAGVILVVFVMSVGCNNSADTEKKAADTGASKMSGDTSKMDTSNPRPVKTPN